MRKRGTQAGLFLLTSLVAVVCTPILSWRDVQLGRLSTLLHCKPDRATRPVTLDGKTVNTEMAGCEASGALFAVSCIQADDATHAPQLLTALRQASLLQVQMLAVHPQPQSGDAPTGLDARVDGKRPDGSAMRARFKWLVVDSEVDQVAAYAEHLGTEKSVLLISEARIG